jgi:hypothetical protein
MKTIKENNRLIAEFMGMQETKIGWYDAEENLSLGYTYFDNTFDELLFNKSWDWLMPVVDAIYNIDIDEQATNEIGDITHALLDVNINAVHEAVVNFIEFYNKQN